MLIILTLKILRFSNSKAKTEHLLRSLLWPIISKATPPHFFYLVKRMQESLSNKFLIRAKLIVQIHLNVTNILKNSVHSPMVKKYKLGRRTKSKLAESSHLTIKIAKTNFLSIRNRPLLKRLTSLKIIQTDCKDTIPHKARILAGQYHNTFCNEMKASTKALLPLSIPH